MGRRNYLIEGVSCSGKTAVYQELQRRGYHAVNGDTELAYQGDPVTGRSADSQGHQHHIWRVAAVEELAACRDTAVTFFCGGSRNYTAFLGLFDAVFVLEIDVPTLLARLDQRTDNEWGARPAERELVLRVHRTGEDTPEGVRIDATRPLACVVEDILGRLSAGKG